MGANNEVVRLRRTSLAAGLGLATITIAFGGCADLSGLAGADDPVDGGKTKESGVGKGTEAATDGGIVPATARCNPQQPFEPPELVTEFDPTAEYVKDAVLTRDELEVFYLRYQGSGNWDLRHARRAARDAAWGAVTTEGVPPSPDGTLSLTAGDLRLYFWTVESNYRTTRPSRNDPFALPQKFDVASAPATFFVAADDTAYFSKSDNDEGFEKIIRRATVNSSGYSLTSTPLLGIHVAKTNDSHPVLDASETVMYFASNRPGGRGLDDVWVTRRPAKQAAFGPPVHVPELSTDEPDAVTWVAEDECELYLYRASHVYIARRPK